MVFGIPAGVLLVVGLLRVFYFEKGAYYYFHTWTFIAKLTLFVLIGLVSIVPTLEFLSWRKAVRQGQAPSVSPAKLQSLRLIMHLELVGVVVIILMAALMAKGVGLHALSRMQGRVAASKSQIGQKFALPSLPPYAAAIIVRACGFQGGGTRRGLISAAGYVRVRSETGRRRYLSFLGIAYGAGRERHWRRNRGLCRADPAGPAVAILYSHQPDLEPAMPKSCRAVSCSPSLPLARSPALRRPSASAQAPIKKAEQTKVTKSPAATHKVAIQVSQNDKAVMDLALNNAKNLIDYYKAKGETVVVEIVTYARGLHMLRADEPGQGPHRAMSLENPNIKFIACANTQANQSKAEGKPVTLLSEANGHAVRRRAADRAAEAGLRLHQAVTDSRDAGEAR